MEKPSFKELAPFERRRARSAWIIDNYPDRLPVILENAWRSQLPDLDKKMFLIPDVWAVRHFVYLIQDKLKLSSDTGKRVVMFVKNMPVPTDASMSTLYEEHADVDGFLYMTYGGETSFTSPQD